MHRLAGYLGGTTVERLIDEMGSAEVTRWIEIDKIESFETRAQWPIAMLASMFFNRYSKKGSSRTKPEDFLYGAKGKSKQKTTEATFDLMDKMAVDKKDGPDKT